MNVFVLGATGYIGGAVARRLLTKGHSVIGLARSDASEATLKAMGIQPVRGNLEDQDSLQRGARLADAVINVAQPRFDPRADFMAAMQSMNETMGNAVDALYEALDGSGKTLLITGGTGAYGDTGEQVVNEDTPVVAMPMMARMAENDRKVLGATGFRGLSIRPGIVYGHGSGPISMLIGMAQQMGKVQSIGLGDNELSFVHVEDIADLYVLMLERAKPGTLLNGVAEPWVTQKAVLGAISQKLGFGGVVEPMPVDQAQAMSYGAGGLFARNMRVSGAHARRLGWMPAQPDVIHDILAN